jgi:hypothetical protein
MPKPKRLTIKSRRNPETVGEHYYWQAYQAAMSCNPEGYDIHTPFSVVEKLAIAAAFAMVGGLTALSYFFPSTPL